MCDEIQAIARRIAADGPRRDHALGNFGASGQSVSG
jgi:hypothetical protein